LSILFTITNLNEMSEVQLVKVLGSVFEHSPWVPRKAARFRPFLSLEDLHKKMVEAVKSATPKEQLNLILSHPNLGAKSNMSNLSKGEQNSAGIDHLSLKDYKRFLIANHDYMNKFGFPFIMAVKGRTKDEIYEAMMERLQNSKSNELKRALEEIYQIALFRLQEMIIITEEV